MKADKSLILLLPLTTLVMALPPVFASEAGEKVEIADQLAREGIYDSALMFYEKALRINPNYIPALSGRENALRHLQHPGGKTKKKKKPKEKKTQSQPQVAKTSNATAVATQTAATAPKPDPAPAPATAPAQTKPPAVAVQTPPAPAPTPTQAASTPAPAATTPTPTPAATATPPKVAKPEVHEPSPSESGTTSMPMGDSAAPPLSSPPRASSTAHTDQAESAQPAVVAPPWLVFLAGATFISLVVMAVLWLSPSLSSSRQLQNRLKNLSKTKGGD